MKYEELEMTVVRFDSTDIITESDVETEGQDF